MWSEEGKRIRKRGERESQRGMRRGVGLRWEGIDAIDAKLREA